MTQWWVEQDEPSARLGGRTEMGGGGGWGTVLCRVKCVSVCAKSQCGLLSALIPNSPSLLGFFVHFLSNFPIS